MTLLVEAAPVRRGTLGWRRRPRNLPLTAAVIVAVSTITVGLLVPISRLIYRSLSGESWPLLRGFLSQANNRRILFNTLRLGVCVAVVGVGVALLLAYVQTRLDVPGKRVLHVIAIIPMVSPPFAVATAVIVLFGRNGIISTGLFGIRYDIYGLDGLTLVLALSFFPVVYLNLVGLLQRLDPSLDEAATNLGASRWHVFKSVTLPLLIPGMASGFLLLFVESLADLANPLVLGGDYTVLSSRAYIAITGEYDLARGAVLSLMLILPSLTVFLVQRYWVDRKSVVTVTGRPSGTVELQRGKVAWLLFSAALLICALIFLIYGTVVVGAFTKVLGVNNQLTLDNARFVLFGIGSEAMLDTTKLALIAAPIAGFLGMVIAWLVVRKLRRGASALDFITMLGVGIPGTVLGIGYLMAFRDPNKLGPVTIIPGLAGGGTLFGGALAITMVLLMRSVPAGLRAGVGALKQIHPSIEEASTSLGADDSVTFRKVTLPLIRPALLSGLSFAFARSMTTLSPIIFLTTPDTKIMTSQILGEVDAGRYGNAFAYCLVLMSIVLVVMGLIRLLVGSTAAKVRVAPSKRTVRKPLLQNSQGITHG
jgi:iron(III) transport system permease protein